MLKRLIYTALLLLVCAPAFAATTPNSYITAQTPKINVVQFLQGTDSAGTYKTVYTGSANGSKIVALWMNNNDPSATHLVTCQVVRSAVFYGGVAITSVVNAGYANAALPQNMMIPTLWPGLPLDSDGNPFIYLSSASDSIQCTFATAITATDAVNVGAVGYDF